MSDVDVVVIGAGAAGLAATRTLLSARRSVMVLEARDRIGGRVWTEPDVFGHPMDHGASFIHVWPNNPWTAIARRLGFETTIDKRRRFLFIEGREAAPADFERFMAARKMVLDQVTAVEEAPMDRSIANMVDIEGPFAAEANASLAPWLLGEDNDEASALDFARGVSGEDRLVPRGYGRLVAAYGRGVPVQLRTVVTHIKVLRDGVEVTANGSRIRAAQAILTVPLGVLALEQITLGPPLEDHHRRAIDGLPMGLLQKIVLAFDGDPFGRGDGFYLHRQEGSADRALYLCRPMGSDHVVAFVGGTLARRLEAEGEAAARDFALQPLRDLFGKTIEQRLLGARQTRWGADPFARGSYAVARPGAANHRDALQRPHAERVHFAGEAAAPEGWAATVAGASMSGRITAERLISGMSEYD